MNCNSLFLNVSRSIQFGNFIRRVSVLLIVLFAAMQTGITSAAEPVSKSRLGGKAIGGHDTVAYHSLSKEPHGSALKGQKTWTVNYKGAKWRFASEQSATLFEANPEQYAPAYNGHCANALSLGEGLVKTDGTHWEIIGDQLYLFYAARGRDRWLSVDDISEYKAAADAAWRLLIQ